MAGATGRSSVPVPLLAVATLAVVGLAASLVAPAIHRAWQHHQAVVARHHHTRALAYESKVRLPATYVLTDKIAGSSCTSVEDSTSVACYRTPGTPEQAGPILREALAATGLSPGLVSCATDTPRAPIGGNPCSVRARVSGWEVSLTAFPNVRFSKPIAATRGHPAVLPAPRVNGTEVILSVESAS